MSEFFCRDPPLAVLVLVLQIQGTRDECSESSSYFSSVYEQKVHGQAQYTHATWYKECAELLSLGNE